MGPTKNSYTNRTSHNRPTGTSVASAGCDDPIVGNHPYDQRPIRLKAGRYGGYLQLGDDVHQSNHPLSDEVRTMLDDHGVRRLTSKVAIQCVSKPRKKATLDGMPIMAGINKFGPFLSYDNKDYVLGNEYMGVLGLDATAVKELLQMQREKRTTTQSIRPVHSGMRFITAFTSSERRYVPDNTKAVTPTTTKSVNSHMTVNDDSIVAHHPHDGRPIRLKWGRFGVYLQLGEGGNASNHALPPDAKERIKTRGASAFTPQEAIEHTCEPKTMKFKVNGEAVMAGISAQGPFLLHGKQTVYLHGNKDIFNIEPSEAKRFLLGRVAESSEPTRKIAAKPYKSPASSFILTTEFTRLLAQAFDPLDECKGLCTSAHPSNLQEQVDVLHDILRTRLKDHIETTLNTESQRKHYVWDFVRANLARLAAAMVAMGHVVSTSALRTALRNRNICLLSKDMKNFLKLEPRLSNVLQGCYLIHHQNGGFIRSGKVAGRPFCERFKDHQDRAMDEEYDSDADEDDNIEWPSIYKYFPSRFAEYNPEAQGYFEDLQFYAGLSFDVEDPHSSLYRYGSSGHGLFVWNPSVIASMKSLDGSLKENQLHFVAYLCELVYNLALSQSNNICASPGFEWPLEFYKKKKKSTYKTKA